jgi:3-oxoadipate enol-lactonase
VSKDSRKGTAEVQGVRLYYEKTGEGEAAIFISGLGGSANLWKRQVPALSSCHTVITFDNRGSARSDVPEGPYTVQTMAADTVQLLDALEIPAAHVVGSSMGAMIAQEVAIQYPDKALTLTLLGAQCGGPHAFVPPPAESASFEELATREMDPAERASAWLPHMFSEGFLAANAELVKEYVDLCAQQPTSTAGLLAQWAALMSYDSWDRLPLVTAPALILHGSEDRLVPIENADVLCVRIPNSRVVVIEGAGHGIEYESADEVNALLLDFFAENRYFNTPETERSEE